MPFPLSFARERHKLRMNEGKSQCVEKDGPLRFGQGGMEKYLGKGEKALRAGSPRGSRETSLGKMEDATRAKKLRRNITHSYDSLFVHVGCTVLTLYLYFFFTPFFLL